MMMSFLVFPLLSSISPWCIVKYLKEVTPYFRKASLLAELGWDLQKEYMAGSSLEGNHVNLNGEIEALPGPPPDLSYSRSDTRCVPLTLALLATNFKCPDVGKSTLKICSASQRLFT